MPTRQSVTYIPGATCLTLGLILGLISAFVFLSGGHSYLFNIIIWSSCAVLLGLGIISLSYNCIKKYQWLSNTPPITDASATQPVPATEPSYTPELPPPPYPDPKVPPPIYGPQNIPSADPSAEKPEEIDKASPGSCSLASGARL